MTVKAISTRIHVLDMCSFVLVPADGTSVPKYVEVFYELYFILFYKVQSFVNIPNKRKWIE